MKIQNVMRAVREPQVTFLRVVSLLVMNYRNPRYNKALYEFCRRYVNFYRNDETGDRDTNGQWRWIDQYMTTKPRVILDIGGFDGAYSLRILRADSNVRLHVFEPDPNSFARLTKVLQGFRNVRLVQKGVSEKSGKMDLYRSEKYPATNSLHYRGNGVGAWNTESKVEVAITTVDEYCTENHIDHIDLLKIDTEGNDYFVLKGAERILRTGRVDTIVFEFSLLYTYSHIYFIDFAEYLGKLGYEISKIMPLGTAPVTEPVYERTQDAYFVAKRKAGKIFA